MALIGISKKKDKRKLLQKDKKQAEELEFIPEIFGISDAASLKILEKSKKDGFENQTLRIKIQGGGCSGLQYIFSFDDEKPSEKDQISEKNQTRVFIDSKSFKVLKGCVLDWQQSTGLSAFVVRNPQAKNACSCGASFTL